MNAIENGNFSKDWWQMYSEYQFHFFCWWNNLLVNPKTQIFTSPVAIWLAFHWVPSFEKTAIFESVIPIKMLRKNATFEVAYLLAFVLYFWDLAIKKLTIIAMPFFTDTAGSLGLIREHFLGAILDKTAFKVGNQAPLSAYSLCPLGAW